MQRTESFDSIPEVEFISTLNSFITDEIKNKDELAISSSKVKENAGLCLPEPLLIEDKSRFVLFPIKHTDVVENKRIFILFLTSTVVDMGDV